MRKLILGIETSCDDTCVAIVENDKILLSNVVSSQTAIHTKYGGVMPEIASRLHAENITMVLEKALDDAKVNIDDIWAVAVTSGPGLIGALHVGVQAAKTIALTNNIPLISVHHLAGHILANEFEEEIIYPAMALIVSGGNTEIVYMKEALSFEVIGQTLDDALGECIDKVARVLGLPYPGGPHIDRLAKEGKHIYSFPLPHDNNDLNVSYSGLKTSLINFVHKMKQNDLEYKIEDVAKSFQDAVIEQIINKTIKALKQYEVKHLVLGGGVAANSYLRQQIQEKVEQLNKEIKISLPSLWCCMDNAAMIALTGSKLYNLKRFANLELGANPEWKIEEFMINQKKNEE